MFLKLIQAIYERETEVLKEKEKNVPDNNKLA